MCIRTKQCAPGLTRRESRGTALTTATRSNPCLSGMSHVAFAVPSTTEPLLNHERNDCAALVTSPVFFSMKSMTFLNCDETSDEKPSCDPVRSEQYLCTTHAKTYSMSRMPSSDFTSNAREPLPDSPLTYLSGTEHRSVLSEKATES